MIIGAAKSGTTALYHYLRQHPQVYMSPQKETNYFAFEGQRASFNGPGDEDAMRDTITTPDAYTEQFAGVTNEVAVGEASPWYLYSERAAENIHRCLPNVKLIVLLRNPVDRAFSSYLHVVRHDRENLRFEEGLLAEEERIAQGWELVWHYRRAGLYVEQIERFLRLFAVDQIRYYLYDDLEKDLDAFLVRVYKFLGVDPSFVADTSLRPNATGVPRSRMVQHLVFKDNPLKALARTVVPNQVRYNLSQRLGELSIVKPTLNDDTRRKLLRDFKKEILALEDLTGLGASVWLE